MNEIEKFLQKRLLRERRQIERLVDDIICGDSRVKVEKIKNTDFYRAKRGKFRVIFHKEGKGIVVDSIRFRNDNTYKNL